MIPLHEFEKATAFDSTLKTDGRLSKQLTEKYLSPQAYSRKRLYDNMYAARTVVFNDYPMKLSKQPNESNKDALIRMLKEGLPKKEKIYIRAGASRTMHKVTINDVIERWIRGRSKFGVTDLHFRGTKFYDKVDADTISYFNLLTHCPYDVSFLEMLTLVVSSKGIFSDSHSDDGDGSNHCFVGKKLWLAWDRSEGQKIGLQDCTYDAVYDQATFSMQQFLSLKSAHWFLVAGNQTLFMPGHFTHKVITLEPYIGFGSFYVTMPSYFNTLKRWLLFDTSDVKGEFLRIMNAYSIRKIKQINKMSAAAKEKWGLDYLAKAARNWKAGLNASQVSILSANDTFSRFLHFASSI
jgi:hypothetical protein